MRKGEEGRGRKEKKKERRKKRLKEKKPHNIPLGLLWNNIRLCYKKHMKDNLWGH